MECISHVQQQLGIGHAECIYQKGISLMLQSKQISHVCEFHVPISFSLPVSTNDANVFNIGDERIDLVLYDADKNAYIVELKAITGTILTKAMLPTQQLPSPYLQLLKYIKMQPVPSIVKGYVVNFRQTTTFASPFNTPIEMVEYDAIDGSWTPCNMN